jgi:hypothetical protein
MVFIDYITYQHRIVLIDYITYQHRIVLIDYITYQHRIVLSSEHEKNLCSAPLPPPFGRVASTPVTGSV